MLDGKTILLTGGTGSFGNAFSARIQRDHPNTTVRIFSRDELKQSEMQPHLDPGQFRFFLGDVRDPDRLHRAVQGADIVIHAAALKQVPAAEYNPFEAVRTNILGAQHIVDAAIDSSVETVIALSTDKAVNPVNMYGATKLCQEKIVVQGNAYASHSGTKLSVVRYGNVVGSRGSVVPVFREQAKTGTITITDERMTRFWITLEQAVDLVMHALATAVGGEIFIPKIPSMRVTDLAAAIAPDCQTKVIGIRPGEKLHELMLTADESRHSVDSGAHFIIYPEHPWWSESGAWESMTPVDPDFIYSSGTNDWWLNAEELQSMLP